MSLIHPPDPPGRARQTRTDTDYAAYPEATVNNDDCVRQREVKQYSLKSFGERSARLISLSQAQRKNQPFGFVLE